MSRLLIKLVSATVVSLIIVGCQTTKVEEAAVENSLPVANAPHPDPVGTVIHRIRNGNEVSVEKLSQDGSVQRFRSGTGCEWTEDIENDILFAPATSWSNCNGRSGEITVTGKTGSIWPMQLGSSHSLEATGRASISSSSWPADFECEVVDEVRVSVVAGTFDTYKIKCTTPWRNKTIYYAPSIDRIVKSLQWPKARSAAERFDWELVRVEQP